MSTDEQAIRDLMKRKDTTWSSGDLDGFLATFSKDAVWCPPGRDDMVGPTALREHAGGLLERSNYVDVAHTIHEIRFDGDLAVERSGATMTARPKDGSETSQIGFRMIHILKRGSDGLWKIAVYAWN